VLKFVASRNRGADIVICGDFNINILQENEISKDFCNLMLSYNLHYNFNKPTRITAGTQTCIDNIFTNFKVNEAEIINSDLSDHTAQVIKISAKLNDMGKGKRAHIIKRRLTAKNIAIFKSKLEGETWDSLYESDMSEPDVNLKYKSFLNTVQYHFQNSFPLRRVQVGKHNKGWVTRGIRISSARKRELHEQSKGSVDPLFLEYVHKYKSIFKKCVQAAKLRHNSDYIRHANNKMKATWDVVKKETGKVLKTGPMIEEIKIDNKFIKNPEDIAKEFNKFFKDTKSRLQVNSNVEEAEKFLNMQPKPDCTFHSFAPVSHMDVIKIISSFKEKNSSGWDEIPISVVKTCSGQLAKPLAYLINLSFKASIFPDLLKLSLIRPVHKKDCKKMIQNYRPISLLPSFSKVFEIVVHLQLIYSFEYLIYFNQ